MKSSGWATSRLRQCVSNQPVFAISGLPVPSIGAHKPPASKTTIIYDRIRSRLNGLADEFDWKGDSK